MHLSIQTVYIVVIGANMLFLIFYPDWASIVVRAIMTIIFSDCLLTSSRWVF